ncbi:helix-turn-helix domain-containing protein [Bizionia sp.]|uniref:helix-turn-helix domain-containing protein n=1 Tax=Bizionia sp. TaxID=1954480 RepID=UPI003A948096
MKLGDKLRVVLEKNGYSVKAYSKKTGINYTQLSQYLNNKRKPSIEFLDTFFNEFPEVDLNWLLRDSESAENFVMEQSEKYVTPINNDDIIKRMEYLLSNLKANLSQK